MSWIKRSREAKLDKLVTRVDEHRPDSTGKCAKCKHQFDGTEEDLRRHHLEVAYRRGQSFG